jgi:hypothetical protein
MELHLRHYSSCGLPTGGLAEKALVPHDWFVTGGPTFLQRSVDFGLAKAASARNTTSFITFLLAFDLWQKNLIPPITREHSDEYSQLFARNDITQGIQRDPEARDAFIIVKSVGLLNRGNSNGYLYCGPGPNHRYPPCFSSQPFGEHPYKPGDEAYSFRKLADRWYAYSEGPS